MLKSCARLSHRINLSSWQMKNLKSIVFLFGLLLALFGVVFLTGLFNDSISRQVAHALSRQPGTNWPTYIQFAGGFFLIIGLALMGGQKYYSRLRESANSFGNFLSHADQWLQNTIAGQLNLSLPEGLAWPSSWNSLDLIILIFFVIVAFTFQISKLSIGFPNVILGGDAANIASFAAGRAFPQLFTGDAILGDLRNIGLYVTIHIPITIWLEKLVGNFGLAYSLLLFPHVLLQYVIYYIFGKVLFKNRYWGFLFSLAISAPLELAGGEVWGVVGDAMPRFTFQVLIPIILIILLTTWRNRPGRWPWIMVIAGLMAFIHPVSTPSWAFALWLGFLPCMPSEYNLGRKLREMLKLGLILVLALLPYVVIYLSYKQGGRSNTNYDLVYLILTNYFPNDILNIPGAVSTLIQATGQYGLLWYALIGLAFTYIYFHSERPIVKQMLIWMVGISVVSIVIPYIEQIIERTLRIIPLQTELMRGMRYLVIFLFIFWFYPFAELTRRSINGWIVRVVYIAGSISVLSWMLINPPLPFTEAPPVMQCWAKGQLICPNSMDYANALTYIRTGTPENAKFVVFLTNRWSGIEVRYLGLRPMAYAYKDRGQLTFTNLDALQTWYYFLRRENDVFSRNISPTLDLQQKRMVDFAFDAEANYMLTNFPFPPDVQKSLGVSEVYRNATFTILRIYFMRK